MSNCAVIFLLVLSATTLNFVHSEIYRLPNNVKPVRYFLTIEPMIHAEPKYLWERTLYNGSVTIELHVLENTNNITFHGNSFEIDYRSIKIIGQTGEDLEISANLLDFDAETYTIFLEEELLKGESYNLTVGNFSGPLLSNEGFFHTWYWVNKKPRRIAATHFEPSSARKAFPCFDEPALKAKFMVSLIRREGYIALSNEELEVTEYLGDGRFKDTFKETPTMSTYLVAFSVSDFKSTKKLGRHRVYARPEAIEAGELDYALEIGVKTLRVLEELTGINFTISKLDQLAVPSGLSNCAAMENWGLVVFNEKYLSCTNKSSAAVIKQVTVFISHEFSHQWFGNLVTPKWWDYMWIKEAIATYFEYYTASFVQPSWRLMDQFLIDMVHTGLEKETSTGGYPLNFPIMYSGQMPPSHILYQKGPSIVRMMVHFLTHDVFKEGIQIFLQNKKFSTAEPSDLYNALQQAVNKAAVGNLLGNFTVADIMKSWDSNKGFPTVVVSRNYDTGGVTFQQNNTFTSIAEENWRIPINYVFSNGGELGFSNTTADFWLAGRVKTLNDCPTDGWLVVNKQQTGHYRVNYDIENWERIIAFLNSDKFKAIHVLNRAQLINDAFYFADQDVLPYEIPLRLCEYLRQEKDYIPFAAFSAAISAHLQIFNKGSIGREKEFFQKHSLKNIIIANSDDEYENYEKEDSRTFQEYIRALLSGVREYLGPIEKPSDTMLDKLNRDGIDRYFSKYFTH